MHKKTCGLSPCPWAPNTFRYASQREAQPRAWQQRERNRKLLVVASYSSCMYCIWVLKKSFYFLSSCFLLRHLFFLCKFCHCICLFQASFVHCLFLDSIPFPAELKNVHSYKTIFQTNILGFRYFETYFTQHSRDLPNQTPTFLLPG